MQNFLLTLACVFFLVQGFRGWHTANSPWGIHLGWLGLFLWLLSIILPGFR